MPVTLVAPASYCESGFRRQYKFYFLKIIQHLIVNQALEDSTNFIFFKIIYFCVSVVTCAFSLVDHLLQAKSSLSPSFVVSEIIHTTSNNVLRRSCSTDHYHSVYVCIMFLSLPVLTFQVVIVFQ